MMGELCGGDPGMGSRPPLPSLCPFGRRKGHKRCQWPQCSVNHRVWTQLGWVTAFRALSPRGQALKAPYSVTPWMGHQKCETRQPAQSPEGTSSRVRERWQEKIPQPPKRNGLHCLSGREFYFPELPEKHPMPTPKTSYSLTFIDLGFRSGRVLPKKNFSFVSEPKRPMGKSRYTLHETSIKVIHQ